MNSVTARVSEKTALKLKALSEMTNRSKSFLVANALERFLEEQEWQVANIAESIEQADHGEFATAAEVKKAFGKWGLKLESD